jgi:toxin ParE1/3/4
MGLELSREAQADLDAVRDYSLAEFGVERAIAYLHVIEAVFRRILDFPEIGPVHEEVHPAVRSVGCQQHRIFYEVEGEAIRILRVLHKAMDAERHL